MMAYLDITDLKVEYDKNVPVMEQFHLSVERGQLVSLLGPSGCGKTTTLRSVAGFITPSAGRITVDGQDITRLAPNKRDIGLVFQSYALFPHLTVFDNIAFGLKMRGVPHAERERRVREAMALVNLEEFAARRPAQLSGGQRQRVALARAVVIEPKLLLLDEPLSNLDAKLRISMRTEIRRLQQRLHMTALYVTHDQVEALAISDVVVVMNRGRIEQIGAPEAIYTNPQTAFVADFLGFSNHFDAQVMSVEGDRVVVTAGGQSFTVRHKVVDNRFRPGTAVAVYFRPESAVITSAPGDNRLPARVLIHTFHGSTVLYVLETALGEFQVNQELGAPQFDEAAVYVTLPPERLILIEKPT